MAYNAPSSYGIGAKYSGTMDLTTNDPRKIAQGTRQGIYQQGQAMSTADQALADKYAGRSEGTQDYLGSIESPLAQGKGGYNAAETSQIRMTPEQQQRIVTGAGISAGGATQAGVNAAQRATAAAGGNPLAMAAYRARAAQQSGAAAGDAMTQARIGASDAAAKRAEAIGGARLGQQNEALGYYQGLQQQQAGEAEQARQRQQQTYATQTGGMNTATQNSLAASQSPGMFDKIVGAGAGAITGAASAGMLADGDFLGNDTPAVVGEDGPEKVVQLPPRNMADGDYMYGDAVPAGHPGPSFANLPHTPDYLAANSAAPDNGTTTTNPDGTLTFKAPGSGSSRPSLAHRLGTGLKSALASPAPVPQPASTTGGGFNPVNTYSAVGNVAGQVASKLLPGLVAHLADGGVAGGSGGGGGRSDRSGGQWWKYLLGSLGGNVMGGMNGGGGGGLNPLLIELLDREDNRRDDEYYSHNGQPSTPAPASPMGPPPVGSQPQLTQPQLTQPQPAMADGAVITRQAPKPPVTRPKPVDQPSIDRFDFLQRQRKPDTDPRLDFPSFEERLNAPRYHYTPTEPMRQAPQPGMADGGVAGQGANGIFTQPTRVNLKPGEAVVPLSYRAGAKVRPHMAALPAAQSSPYRGRV